MTKPAISSSRVLEPEIVETDGEPAPVVDSLPVEPEIVEADEGAPKPTIADSKTLVPEIVDAGE
jgi:hypothetical protein